MNDIDGQSLETMGVEDEETDDSGDQSCQSHDSERHVVGCQHPFHGRADRDGDAEVNSIEDERDDSTTDGSDPAREVIGL